MSRIISLKEWDKAFEKAKQALLKGEVIIYPTDTVYGIGCDALNKEAVKKVYEIKKREISKPLSLLISGLDMLLKYFKPTTKEIEYFMKHMPGPYTFIIESKVAFPYQPKRVGVRVPAHFFGRKLSEEIGKPIITTSANISGKEPALKVEEIEEEIKSSVEVIIDGGEAKYKKPSTVVDIKNKKIIREGAKPFHFE